MKALLISLIVILVPTCSLFAQEKRHVTLHGKSHRPLDTIVIAKITDRPFDGIEIPVKQDSTFHHTIDIYDIEEYELIFKSDLLSGAWRPIYFYPDGPQISFDLYAEKEFKNNVISGSLLAIEKKKFNEEKEAIFSKEFSHWYELLYSEDQDSMMGVEIQHKLDSLTKAEFNWQHNYFSDSPSIVGFYEYYHSLKWNDRLELNDPEIYEVNKFWISQFPNHPLSEIVQYEFTAQNQIVVGGSYIDFKLVEKLNGEHILFSEVLDQNKYMLLDLWAPWCGPCIRKSQNIKENFKELDAQGLNIVGVIGGIEDYSKYETARLKYHYPWRVFAEVNNENKIWEKYGIANAGGIQYLIDNSDKILAINPDVELIFSLMEK